MKRVNAIVFIFFGAALAWLILGQTILMRTQQSDESQVNKLESEWGSSQTQLQPVVTAWLAKGGIDVPLGASRIDVKLDLVQRQVGLLWYNLYDVSFAGRYRVRNDTAGSRLALQFPFPSSNANFTNFTCRIDGRPVDDPMALNGNGAAFTLAPGKEAVIDVGYQSRGMDSWQYRFGQGIRSVGDFDLTMTTNFNAIDFPAQTLAPVQELRAPGGWRLRWHYGSLVTANGIGMSFPYPLQPGPLAQRITFWAPVALLFYFFVMVIITTLRGVDLHPVNYFFLACAFFAFHLLFAYLVDRIPIAAAFVICSLVSMGLTVSYLRLVVGWRFASVESGAAQLLYLVLFSFALFNEGWSGLAITIGAIVTLFVAMQATGRKLSPTRR